MFHPHGGWLDLVCRRIGRKAIAATPCEAGIRRLESWSDATECATETEAQQTEPCWDATTARIPVSDPAWRLSDGIAAALPFASEWGAPYGDQTITLQPGQSMSIEVEASDLAIAYLDAAASGTLHVTVGGKEKLKQACNVPFTDSDGKQHFIENRRGIRNLGFARHTVRLHTTGAPVKLLALYGYDTRP